MSKKTTKGDWFAAASAQDLWAAHFPTTSYFSCYAASVECGADPFLFDTLFQEVDRITGETYFDDVDDKAFLAAQIGCQKAGLCR
jgi:hypothetical protein